MINCIKNSILFRPLAFLLATSVTFLSFSNTKESNTKESNTKESVTLKAGTIIPLETISQINSEFLTIGSSIDFTVVQDVKVQGKTVIRAGGVARGQVVRVDRARNLGRAGYVEVDMKYATAVDGSKVLIHGGNVGMEGNDKKMLSIGLGIFVCILFLLMKGKNAIIPQGYGVNVSVTTSSEINV